MTVADLILALQKHEPTDRVLVPSLGTGKWVDVDGAVRAYAGVSPDGRMTRYPGPLWPYEKQIACFIEAIETGL
jgi:hypothetical protein